MNKKIALSGLSIVAALTLMGGATFAAFTTTATATDNTFSTTTPTLTISTDGTHFGTSEPGFTVGGLVPGGSTANQNFSLQNINTDPTGDLTVFLKFTNLSGSLNGDDISFTVDCGGGPITDTYSHWVSTGNDLNIVLLHNSTQACTMKASLVTGAGNTDAGKNVNFDAVFTGSVGS